MLLVSSRGDISQRLLTSRLIAPAAKSPLAKLASDFPEAPPATSDGSTSAIAIRERRVVITPGDIGGTRWKESAGRAFHHRGGSRCERRAHTCYEGAPKCSSAKT
jgi:hypothetical protein